MKFRDYQVASIDAIFEYFARGGTGNPIVALPTGTGKSVVIAGFIQRALMTYPQTRVMKLTHVKELIQQNLEKLLAVWPTAPAGVYSSGLGRKDAGYPIVFGGVATVAKANPDLFGRVDLLVIDECHLVSPKEMTMYQVIIRVLKEINPFLKVIGFTATPYRLGHGMLTDQGGLFTDICFDMTGIDAFNWLLAEGYLSPLIPKRTNIELDVSGVGVHGGEFKANELQAAVDKQEVTYAALRECQQYGSDRNHWLLFASGIEHAIHIHEMLESLGVSSTFVHSKMKDTERDNNIARFKAGKVQAMVNNGILTTGFDYPQIDLIAALRPTQSTSLWVQMLGRGTRPVFIECYQNEYGVWTPYDLDTKEGRLASIAAGPKQNCLVLDFAGNTRRLGPINNPVLPKRKGKGGGGTAPVKVCEACGCYNHASVRFCEFCGEEFPRHLKINQQAGTDELIVASEGPEIPKTEVFKVDRVTYGEHRKEDRPSTIMVSYFCGLRMFKEWVCLEHDGYPGKKARDWWRDRVIGYEEELPETTMDALTRLDTLKTPTHIRVWLKPKYDEVIAYDYSGTGFGGL